MGIAPLRLSLVLMCHGIQNNALYGAAMNPLDTINQIHAKNAATEHNLYKAQIATLEQQNNLYKALIHNIGQLAHETLSKDRDALYSALCLIREATGYEPQPET